MSTGRIQPPNLDDRTWQDIVDEMIGNIPKVAPEWTDHNPSDLGIAMIELFAWMAEMIIYRLNQVPEKNYIAFLNLLDITRDPPTPAKVELTFEISEGNIIIPKGTQVSTVPTEQEEAVVFEIDEDHTLPGNYMLTEQSLDALESEGIPQDIIKNLENIKSQVFLDENEFLKTVKDTIGEEQTIEIEDELLILKYARIYVTAINALTIEDEVIGISNGKPFQIFELKNSPLYEKDEKYEMTISVESEPWTCVDEFITGDITKKYRCNPIAGEILFGNEEAGGIPEKNKIIKASYRYAVGGILSNVAPNTVTLLKKSIDHVKSVTNPQPATGGTDWEKIEDTKRRAPQSIKSLNRAVTAEDYEDLVMNNTGVYKCKCLGPKRIGRDEITGENIYEAEPIDRSPGKVYVLVLPKVSYDSNNRQPEPSIELIEKIEADLDKHRIITSELHLHHPEKEPPENLLFYVEIAVDVTIYVPKDQNNTNIEDDVKNELQRFLHPVFGKLDGNGWDFGEDLYLPDLFESINSIENVSYVDDLTLTVIRERNGKRNEEKVTGIRVPVKEFEIICAALITEFDIKIEEELEM